MFCKHEWQVLSETVTKSKFEVTMELMSPTYGNVNLPHQLIDANRKHIQVFTCSKCGKLKRFVEKI